MSQAETTGDRPAAKAIDEFLKQVAVKRGSDMHFIAGEPARVRLFGDLQVLTSEVLAPARVEETLLQIMSAAARADFAKRDSTDFAYALEGVAAFASTCSATWAAWAQSSAPFRRRRRPSRTSTCRPC
jgi:Tfp pilus assembly pilus retraction ATPase PilT